MAEREERLRFISPEPKLAQALRRLEKEIKIEMLPPEYRDYVISWIEDIGSIMRSRSYMAGTVAMYLSMAVITLPFTLMPELTRRFTFVSKILGVK